MRSIAFFLPMLFLCACAHIESVPRPSEFIVFFSAGSAQFTSESVAVLDDAAAAIRSAHPAAVAIASGIATGNNLRLSEPRFAAVASALAACGVPRNLIARSSLPDAKLSVGATGAQRVEIMLLARRPG